MSIRKVLKPFLLLMLICLAETATAQAFRAKPAVIVAGPEKRVASRSSARVALMGPRLSGQGGYSGVMRPPPGEPSQHAWRRGNLPPGAGVRAALATGTMPISGTVANSPPETAQFSFISRSQTERAITTNNLSPGGMKTMMRVNFREPSINESN